MPVEIILRAVSCLPVSLCTVVAFWNDLVYTSKELSFPLLKLLGSLVVLVSIRSLRAHTQSKTDILTHL